MHVLLNHFRLKESPFGIVTNPKFAHLGREQRGVVSTLSDASRQGQGIGVLAGPPGVGKTTLLDYLSGELPARTPITWLTCTSHTGPDLARALLSEMDLPANFPRHQSPLNRVRLQLQMQSRGGARPLLVFDEAHTLSAATLAAVRQWNLLGADPSRKGFIVFAGRLPLLETLKSPRLEPLVRDIVVQARLSPLTPDAVADYVRHRLKTAGREQPLFTEAALAVLGNAGGGIPRHIDRLCLAAMARAYTERELLVSEHHVRKAAQRLAMDSPLEVEVAARVPDPSPTSAAGVDREQAGEPTPLAVRSLLGSLKWDLSPVDGPPQGMETAPSNRPGDGSHDQSQPQQGRSEAGAGSVSRSIGQLRWQLIPVGPLHFSAGGVSDQEDSTEVESGAQQTQPSTDAETTVVNSSIPGAGHDSLFPPARADEAPGEPRGAGPHPQKKQPSRHRATDPDRTQFGGQRP